MSGQHAYLPPSGAAAWVHCALWAAMQQRYPDAGDDEKAREGEAAHWVNTEAMRGYLPVEGQRAPNGVAVTDEMLEGAEIWVDAVGPHYPSDVRTEQTIPAGHRLGPAVWGTPDLSGLWMRERTTLRVLDYKFGHRHVEAFENWQGIAYTGLELDRMGVNGTADQMLDVEITIVQPRSYHPSGPVRTWHVGAASNLRPYINRLRNAADKATQPVELLIGTVNDECRDCNGRHACQALQRNALAAIDYAGGSAPIALPPDALGRELRALQRAKAVIEARETGLEQQALSVIKGGARVPFFMVEHGKGRERWARPVSEVVALGAMLGVPLNKPAAITPKQARDAGMPPEVVAAYSETPHGAAKLVPDDGGKARAAFGASKA